MRLDTNFWKFALTNLSFVGFVATNIISRKSGLNCILDENFFPLSRLSAEIVIFFGFSTNKIGTFQSVILSAEVLI